MGRQVMDKDIISIIHHGHGGADRIAGALAEKLRAAGFAPVTGGIEGASLIIVIGGDGSFLRTLRQFDFPAIPFVGVNTGHLGFFQELFEEDIDEFIEKYNTGRFKRQSYRTVSGCIEYDSGRQTFRALNEIAIKAADSRLAHLDIYIGENLISEYHGDGVLISTPAGSTAYNYALGGSIVDPRLDLLQLTPIAPVNTTAYRSFTSGIALPPGLPVRILISDSAGSSLAAATAAGANDEEGVFNEILIATDGNERRFSGVIHIEAGLSEQSVELLRFKDNEFWTTVKQKLLTP